MLIAAAAPILSWCSVANMRKKLITDVHKQKILRIILLRTNKILRLSTLTLYTGCVHLDFLLYFKIFGDSYNDPFFTDRCFDGFNFNCLW